MVPHFLQNGFKLHVNRSVNDNFRDFFLNIGAFLSHKPINCEKQPDSYQHQSCIMILAYI